MSQADMVCWSEYIE